MVHKKFCILFAGPIGSSKTPIANFLSEELDLPVFSDDSIRTEVSENRSKLAGQDYLIKRDERLREMLRKNVSFILDASIDREWDLLKKHLGIHKYDPFIISLDLSREMMLKLYKAKDYTISDSLDRTIREHELFLKKHASEANVHIRDGDFKNRMKISLESFRNWDGRAVN